MRQAAAAGTIAAPRAPRDLIVSASSAAYGHAALDREIERLVLASSGTRNATLNCTSYCLHQLVAGSELQAGEVAERLVAAAQANGLVAENGLDGCCERSDPAPMRDCDLRVIGAGRR